MYLLQSARTLQLKDVTNTLPTLLQLTNNHNRCVHSETSHKITVPHSPLQTQPTSKQHIAASHKHHHVHRRGSWNKTESDKASQLLSMSRQRADSIVEMMKALHKQLHPDVEYTEITMVAEDKPSTDILSRQHSIKSILKTISTEKRRDSPQHGHAVRINQDRNIINSYITPSHSPRSEGMLKGLKFSQEFHSVYSEFEK